MLRDTAGSSEQLKSLPPSSALSGIRYNPERPVPRDGMDWSRELRRSLNGHAQSDALARELTEQLDRSILKHLTAGRQLGGSISIRYIYALYLCVISI